MNIALTGANGSIGRELRPFLKHQGHNVFSISTSSPSDGKLSFTYEELIGKTIDVKIDIFLHLASINSNLKEEEINKEIKLTKDMLLSLPTLNCKKLIFFSSAKVYGDNSTSKVFYSEDDDLNPRCSYGKAKKLSEELIQLKSSSMGIKSIILRLPPVLSKSTKSNLGKLIKFSQRKISLPIFAQGFKNQRSFLSLNNLKTIINYAIQNNESFLYNDI
jgi:UDP-glucose 4-epimerase